MQFLTVFDQALFDGFIVPRFNNFRVLGFLAWVSWLLFVPHQKIQAILNCVLVGEEFRSEQKATRPRVKVVTKRVAWNALPLSINITQFFSFRVETTHGVSMTFYKANLVSKISTFRHDRQTFPGLVDNIYLLHKWTEP